MDIETQDNPDDASVHKTAADAHYFTKHSDPVTPVSSEDEIKTEAKNVVPIVPLPEHKEQEIIVPKEDVTRDIKQSAIRGLDAEDIHESQL